MARAIPIDTWMVVERQGPKGLNAVSLHASQAEAEQECDRRNRQAAQSRYVACIALEPVAERMGRPTRLT
jgi:hypothetical protein